MPLLARGGRRATRSRSSVLASLRSLWWSGKEAEPGPVPRRAHPRRWRPTRRAARRQGCGTTTAAALVVRRWRQPRQAEGPGGVLDGMCGASPIPASSGKYGPAQAQPRRQPAGELGADQIAIKRMAYDERTRRYVARRTSRGEVPAGGGPLPEALHSAGGVPRAHGPEPRRRRDGRPRAREDAQGDAGDSEESRRGAWPVRSHSGTWNGETAVDETGEEVLRAPVRIWRKCSRKLPLDNL